MYIAYLGMDATIKLELSVYLSGNTTGAREKPRSSYYADMASDVRDMYAFFLDNGIKFVTVIYGK